MRPDRRIRVVTRARTIAVLEAALTVATAFAKIFRTDNTRDETRAKCAATR